MGPDDKRTISLIPQLKKFYLLQSFLASSMLKEEKRRD